MVEDGLEVRSVDLREGEDYMRTHGEYDGIWCCHVLEHQRNVGDFLEKIRDELVLDGLLAVTVPPAKQNLVGGHVTLWNAGLLLYNLILAGFDCSEARVGTYGYNVSVLVRKKLAEVPELKMDRGDIKTLAHLFPMVAYQNMDGQIENINW